MAKQIRLFGMTRMTAGSCAHYHNEVIRLIGELTPEALGIADQLPAYAKQAALLSSLVPRPRLPRRKAGVDARPGKARPLQRA